MFTSLLQPPECTIEGWCDAGELSSLRSLADASPKLSLLLLAFAGASFWLPSPWQPSLPPWQPPQLAGVAMGSWLREPRLGGSSAPKPASPLLPAAEGHKKRVGFSRWELMRSKCFPGSSLFSVWVARFYFLALLPPLARKPLIPQQAPGAKSKTPKQGGARRGRGTPARGRGCRREPGAGAALRCGEKKGGWRAAPASLRLQRGSGLGFPPSGAGS